jgi:sugar phosphate isomerase/epimerase
MSDIGFSVSGSFFDDVREGDHEALEELVALRDSSDFIEYHNDQQDEFASYIKSDVEMARRRGLSPRSIHLSNKPSLGTEEGFVDLNTAVRNSQLQIGETGDETRYNYWDPEVHVVHPPVLKKGQGLEQRTRDLVRDIAEVNREIQDNPDLAGVVGLENMPQNSMGYLVSTPEDFERVERTAEEMGLEELVHYVFDPGHSGKDNHWSGFMDVLPPERTEEFHVHDWHYDQETGAYEAHVPPGEGDLDIDGMLERASNEFDADYVLELKPSEFSAETVRDSADYVRERI